jgi:hypothetical protein
MLNPLDKAERIIYADDVVSGHRQCGSGETYLSAMAVGIALMLTMLE